MPDYVIKDPDAVLDYRWEWSDWLDGSDGIASHEVILPVADGGLVVDSSEHDATGITAWISGGQLGADVWVTGRITTTEGRTDDRSLRFRVQDR